MKSEELIKQAKRIISTGYTQGQASSKLIESLEFLRVYAGEKSSFYQNLKEIKQTSSDKYIMEYVQGTLAAFMSYLQSGLGDGVSIERKAQIDVVSDILEQANGLLNSKGIHPAAPAVIIGAALEEFLRNWIEEDGLDLGAKKPSLDSYAKMLREANLITKQDIKDITSWAGVRNHAAHGEWDEVNDKKRIAVMLEGVNLFMRRYGPSGI